MVFTDMFRFEVVKQVSRVTALSQNCCRTHSTEYSLLLLVGPLKSKPIPNDGSCTFLFHQLLRLAFSHIYLDDDALMPVAAHGFSNFAGRG